ncbi:MAG TPA: alpha/beta hydrolase [Microthrixaceae bacterium]|nr:alpha/beta hydrolase [Microthrixaceae bacterium]
MKLGADSEALRNLGVEMTSAAETIDSSRRQVESELRRAWWTGGAGERFRRQWIGEHGPALRGVQRSILIAGRTLIAQASQQEQASGVTLTHQGAVPAAPRAIAMPAEQGALASLASLAVPAAPVASPGATSESPAGTFERAFSESQNEFGRRLRILRAAEQVELAERRKWWRLRARLGDRLGDRLEEMLGGRLWGQITSRLPGLSVLQLGGRLPFSSDRLGLIQRAIAEHEALVDPKRQFLSVGNGQLVEVFGDLETASRIGIWVPGVGTDMGNFADPTTLTAYRIWDADPDLAMVEWLGYEPPSTIPYAAVELGHGARGAGEDLNELVAQLKQMRSDSPAESGTASPATASPEESSTVTASPATASPTVIIGGHSYGAVVAASAASAGTVADGLVLAGSPGAPVSDVEEFRLAGRPAGAENVVVVSNDFDLISLGHLADEAIGAYVATTLIPIPMGPAARLASWMFGSGANPSWWSEMAHDPNSDAFGARQLPANETKLSGALTGFNHRYSDLESTSLASLRSAFRQI